MKKLARIILENTVSHFPKTHLEIGRGMLAELEEMQGIEALIWALGGLEMLIKLHGGTIMKNILVAIGMLSIIAISSYIYISGQFVASVILLGLSVIALVAIQPKNAIWFALTMAVILPVTHLAQTYTLVRNDLFLIESEIGKVSAGNIWINIDHKNPMDVKIEGEFAGVKSQTAEKTMYGIVSTEISTSKLTEMTRKSFQRVDKNVPIQLALYGILIALGLMLVTLFTRQHFSRSTP